MRIIEIVIETLSTIAVILLITIALHLAFGGSDPFEPCPIKVVNEEVTK
jgi:hypothetical protein